MINFLDLTRNLKDHRFVVQTGQAALRALYPTLQWPPQQQQQQDCRRLPEAGLQFSSGGWPCIVPSGTGLFGTVAAIGADSVGPGPLVAGVDGNFCT